MFNRLYKKLGKEWLNLSKKRRIFYSVLLSVLLLVIVIPSPVHANLGSALASLLGLLIAHFITFLSKIITLEINIFAKFAQFNNFLGVTAVKEGWKLVRDICNMFFILILLVISFATILKIESYAYKKWLGKLVIAAILINFSKTITGLLIGFSQVVMLTFVSAFKDAVAGNLGAGLHLNEMMSASVRGEATGNFADNNDNLDALAVFGALLLALILLTVFVIVMLIMIVVLVGRIVSLWVLVILSPLAFLLQASPFGAKYAKQWWQELGKNLVSGPVLAFFLWLAFLTIQRSSGKVAGEMSEAASGQVVSEFETSEETEFISGISSTSALMDYIVTIALLMAAIKLTQELGVIGSSFAGKMQQSMGSMGKKIAMGGTLGLAKYADRKLGSAKWNKFGISGHMIANKAKGIQASWAKSANDEKSKIRRMGALNASHSSGIVRAALGSGKDWADRYGPVGLLGVKGAYHSVRDTLSKGLDTHAKISEDAEKEKEKNDEEMKRREVIELEIIAKPTTTKDNLVKADADLKESEDELKAYNKEIKDAGPDLEEDEKKKFRDGLRERTKERDDAKKNQIIAKTADDEWNDLSDEERQKAEDEKIHVESIRSDREKIKEIQGKMGKEKKGSKEYKKLKAQETAAEKTLTEKEKKYGLAKMYNPEGEGDFAGKSSAELTVSSNHQLEIKKKADKKLNKLSMGRSLSARVEERSQIEESKKKYSHLKGFPELIQYLDKALDKGEEFDAIGLMEKLTEDGNENEFLQHYGYESGPVGLHKFVQEKLIKKQSMDEQLALGLQNDIGEIAKVTGHWEVAETTDIDKTGKLRSTIKEVVDVDGNITYDLRDHTIGAHVEFNKRDKRKMMQNTNRLGIGSEDPNTGEFTLSNLGRLIMLDLSENEEFIEKRIAELNPNLLATMTRPNVRRQIEQVIGKRSKLYKKLDHMTGKRIDTTDMGAKTETVLGMKKIEENMKKYS